MRAIGDNYHAKVRHPITTGLFQNGRTGGVRAWGGVLSFVSCRSHDLCFVQ